MRPLVRPLLAAAALAIVCAQTVSADPPAPAAAGPSPAVQQAGPPVLKPVPDGGLYVGLGGGSAPARDGLGPPVAVGSLTVDRHLAWRLGVWLSGETMLVFRPEETDLALRIVAGLRVDLLRSERKRVRWIGTLAFAHQHQARLSSWGDHFGHNLAGSSEYGLGHRSGMEFGTGLVLTPWIESTTFARRLRVLARVSGVWLPHGEGPAFLVSAVTSVGIAL